MAEEIDLSETMLKDAARLFYAVFSNEYNEEMEKKLVAGGGGNSMFVNAWDFPAGYFRKFRISSEAEKRLKEFGYNNYGDAPHGFKKNNAKGAIKRKDAGKELHHDHNPGNVKVLRLIRDRVRSYKIPRTDKEYDAIISDFAEYLRNIQTIDIITVEQDDIRSLSDTNMSKKDKEMLSAKDRDKLLGDIFTDL